MVGGFVVSILAIAVGAVLDFAVVVSPYQHGFNIKTVGVILMIVGAIGAVISLAMALAGGWRLAKAPERDRRWTRERRSSRGHVLLIS